MPTAFDTWYKRAVDVGLLNDGGRLQPAQADRFIDLVVDETVLMKMCRVIRTNNPRGELDLLDISEPVTESVGEDTDTGRVYEPVLSAVEYNCKKLRSAVDFTAESFEENIEGDALRTRVMTAITQRIAIDLESLAIRGDSVTYAASTDRWGRLWRRLDGWGIQALAGHIVNLNGATMSKEAFNSMLKAMPNRYKMNKNALKFFLGVGAEQDYRNALSNRLTGGGDDWLTNGAALQAFGVGLVPVGLFPEDLDRANDSEINTDGSYIWLTDPMNLITVIQRDIEIHWEYVPRRDRWQATIYTRVDDIILNTDAFVTGSDLQIEAV